MTKKQDLCFLLSTHDLTRRSTSAGIQPASMRQIFQLTTSHGGRPDGQGISGLAESFNSRPHTEVDPASLSRPESLISFNSRPHTEVDSQSTRTAWQPRPFNSRPHTEVDPTITYIQTTTVIFQLTTSHGGRRSGLGSH